MSKITSIISFVLFLLPSGIRACAVCYGAADDPMTQGMDMAIIFLLCTVGSVLLGIIAVTIYFARRAKLVNN
jgi:hypothetical protein